MREIAHIWLPNATKTLFAGCSFARTISTIPLTILLEGELGAGKTTFLQGFAKGLGVQENITSPTYALEQRYQGVMVSLSNHTPSFDELRMTHGSPLMKSKTSLLHLDLFRLSKREAEELVDSTTGFKGIRCIEWAERLPRGMVQEPYIRITLQEGKGTEGRLLTISFHDLPLPSRRQILEWRREVMLPSHIARHCDAVGKFAKKLALRLLERGIICRPLTLQKAGGAHDLFRFLDFRPGGWEGKDSQEQRKHWEQWRKKFRGLRHEAACAQFLKEHGYGALAGIVAVHGLTLPPPPRVTIEQKILFYADKRMRIDEVVSLDERFQDFRRRYGSTSPVLSKVEGLTTGGSTSPVLSKVEGLTTGGKGRASAEHKVWYDEARRLERELFPDGPP